MDKINLFSSISSLPLAMFLLSAHPAFAQENQPASSSPYEVTVTNPAQAISLPKHEYKLVGWDFDDIRGGYVMQNGKELFMTSHGRSYFADLSGFERKELVAAAPNVFVAKDKSMKMAFTRYPNGIVSEVTLTYVDRTPGYAAAKPVTLVALVGQAH